MSTDDETLIVTNDRIVEAGSDGSDATLNVDQDGLVNVDDITINDGGQVNITSGLTLHGFGEMPR